MPKLFWTGFMSILAIIFSAINNQHISFSKHFLPMFRVVFKRSSHLFFVKWPSPENKRSEVPLLAYVDIILKGRKRDNSLKPKLALWIDTLQYIQRADTPCQTNTHLVIVWVQFSSHHHTESRDAMSNEHPFGHCVSTVQQPSSYREQRRHVQ